MKKIGYLFVTLGVIVFLAGPSIVLAQEDATQDSATSSGSPGSASTEVQEDTQAADFQAKLKERLAKNKEALKTKLTNAQQARIKARCKAAQGKTTAVSARLKTFREARVTVYEKISSRLSDVSSRLKEAGADTATLDQQIAELNTKIEAFNTDVNEAYQAAIDVSNMDCSTDPASFKAALESMRAERESLASNSASIRAYITETIKPTLQALRQALQGTNSQENN